MSDFSSLLDNLDFDSDFIAACIHFSRYILPLLAIWLLARCVRSMLRERYEPELWGYLIAPDGVRHTLRHWECIIGRSSGSDVTVTFPTVSRSHAALIRGDSGEWQVYDLRSKGGTLVSGAPVENGAVITDGDELSLAGVTFIFEELSKEDRRDLAKQRRRPGRYVRPSVTLLILTAMQSLLALHHSVYSEPEYSINIVLTFAAVCVLMWLFYIITRTMRRTGFEVETIAFFLTTLGVSVAAGSAPEDMLKQLLLIIAGLASFTLLGWWLRDLRRTNALRWPAAGAALFFLALNLVLSEEIFGAKNWLYIAGFSIQPSEFVKLLYIYAGAATLDRLYMDRNLFMFIGFSAICVGALALMGDFGTALVFFATFLVISFMRSGNLATIILAVSSAGLAGFLVLTAKPHIAQRFATWGHVWEYPYDAGYQQTRALSAAASGGLFGFGAGNGWLTGIVAADTDMVFAVLSEELGLLTALCAVAAIIILATFAVKNAAQGRSSFYVIVSCAAVSMMMIQMGLNVFGSLDILPFTGVTFPFVSRGGSSLVSCWALLAYVKASDTRRDASFVVRRTDSRRRKARYDDYDDESYDDDCGDDYYDDYGESRGDGFDGGDSDGSDFVEGIGYDIAYDDDSPGEEADQS